MNMWTYNVLNIICLCFFKNKTDLLLNTSKLSFPFPSDFNWNVYPGIIVNDIGRCSSNFSVSSHSWEYSCSFVLLLYLFHGNCSTSSVRLNCETLPLAKDVSAFSARHTLNALKHLVGPSCLPQLTNLATGWFLFSSSSDFIFLCSKLYGDRGSACSRHEHNANVNIAASTRIAVSGLIGMVRPSPSMPTV